MVIGLISFVALWPVLRAAFVWDDDLYLRMNKTLASSTGWRDIWLKPYSSPSPYPLVFSTYWIEYQFWGLNPMGYRLVNLMLHVANSVLVWRVLERLGLKGAWLAGLVFAIHPVHVESVAQAAERKDVLSGLFYLLAFRGWLDFESRGGGRYYGQVIICFFAAMLSKTVTCTLPVFLLLLVLFRSPRDRRVRLILATLPLFVIALVLGGYTMWWERHRTGATEDVISLAVIDRCLIAARALWFYFWKLAWPGNLVLIYPKWSPSPESPMDWIFPMGAAAVGIAAVARWRSGRALLIACFLYVMITLGPALGFINFSTMYYSYVMDHYQYLACGGWIALGCTLWQCAFHSPRLAFPQRTLLGIVIATMMFLSCAQAYVHRDLVAFWGHNARGNPGSASAGYDFGVALEDEGRTDEAEAQFLKAIRINPNDVDSFLHLAGIHRKRGELEKAVKACQFAANATPDHAKAGRSQAAAWNIIGAIRMEQARPAEAVDMFRRALVINDGLADARINLGIALEKSGDIAAALEAYRAAARRHPLSEKAAVLLHKSLRGLNDPGPARREMERLIRENPRHLGAHLVLARDYLEYRELDPAKKHAAAALEIDPRNGTANNIMGVILAESGDRRAAAEYFHRALEADPNDTSARDNLRRAEQDSDNHLP